MTRKKTETEIAYLYRVKEYVDLSKIKTRDDMEVRLGKKGLLGKYKKTKQLNIIADELGFKRYEKGEKDIKRGDIDVN